MSANTFESQVSLLMKHELKRADVMVSSLNKQRNQVLLEMVQALHSTQGRRIFRELLEDVVIAESLELNTEDNLDLAVALITTMQKFIKMSEDEQTAYINSL